MSEQAKDSSHSLKLGDLDLTPVTNSFVFTISRDMAIMHGHEHPTPEEVERYNAESRERWEKARAEWREADAFREALSGVDDTVARVVLDLHRPIDDDTADCYGCPTDHDEYDEWRQDWPCPTVKAVARAVGIEPPDGVLGHRPAPEPYEMPAEGYKPFVPPMRKWHTAIGEAFDREMGS